MAPLDYADPRNWSVRPGGTGIAARFLAPADAAATVDIFYVHPTTYAGPDWNQPAADEASRDWTDRSAVIRHLDPFADSCRIFAPRYRQASIAAVRQPGADADAAWALAYQDVCAAFAHYLRHDHGGRRFILFGHSQGALHAGRMLAEIIEAQGLDHLLVAAYLPGIGISEGLFGKFYRRVAPCMAPAQTGCVVSWNSFLDAADPAAFYARTLQRDRRRLGDSACGAPLCINPLSFDAGRPDVAAAENPGSLVGEVGLLPLAPLQPGLAGAYRRDGILRITPPPLELLPLPGGNMHMHDIALFHAALRQDALRRIATTMKDADDSHR